MFKLPKALLHFFLLTQVHAYYHTAKMKDASFLSMLVNLRLPDGKSYNHFVIRKRCQRQTPSNPRRISMIY